MTAKDVQQANAELRRLITEGGMEGMPARVIRAAMQDNATELRAALLPFDASANWLPIESAPRGTWNIEGADDRDYVPPPDLILLTKLGEKLIGRWSASVAPGGAYHRGGDGWIDSQGVDLEYDPPTHYMPLPAALEAT